MSSFNSFTPGSSLSLPSQPATSTVNGGSGLSFPTASAPSNSAPQGFSLPPLPTPSDPKSARLGDSDATAASLTAASSGAVQAMSNPVPSHGIVPTLQCVYFTTIAPHGVPILTNPLPLQKHRRHGQPECQTRLEDDCTAWVSNPFVPNP